MTTIPILGGDYEVLMDDETVGGNAVTGMRMVRRAAGAGTTVYATVPLVYAAERLTKIENIKARYPKVRVDYLQSRIREAEENIERTTKLKQELAVQISEYTSHISLCRYRDCEIERAANIADEFERTAYVKDLNQRFPLYSVVAMEQQIQQSSESISRADGVIAAEYKSIAELNGVIQQCARRDAELKALGA